jgi:GDP-mannose 6-dehydrogenase
MAEIYKDLPGEIIITDLKVVEIMKYINNTFHALKISFANEIGNICKALDIDAQKVMELFVKDMQLNISPYYFKPGFAYGGSCLPKDLKGLQTLAHDNYIKVPVIESIDKTNQIQFERAIDVIDKHKNRKIGILGLSFKAGTDDLRNSPTVTLVETLLGKGCNISIYDRNVAISDLTGTNKEYITSHIPHLSKLMTNDALDMISKSDVLVVTTKEKEFSELLKNVDDKLIIDLVYLNNEIRKKGNYYGINW